MKWQVNQLTQDLFIENSDFSKNRTKVNASGQSDSLKNTFWQAGGHHVGER
jgi:hypothetical protein